MLCKADIQSWSQENEVTAYVILMSKHLSLLCEKWLTDSLIFQSEYSLLNLCQLSNSRFKRQMVRDMAYSLAVTETNIL
jgi:uncharacterized membrane protein SirB2